LKLTSTFICFPSLKGDSFKSSTIGSKIKAHCDLAQKNVESTKNLGHGRMSRVD
jgi:hypothetical protein